MPSRDIYEVFRSLVEDERFRDAGLALGRTVVDDVLIFEIRFSDFDFDSDTLGYLKEVAEREGLTLDEDDGDATLRERPDPKAP